VRFMPYADDVVWLLFGLGLAMVLGVILAYIVLGLYGWASLGFLGTGALVSVSFYFVGEHPPISTPGSPGGDDSNGRE
jgi:hypothetical protein